MISMTDSRSKNKNLKVWTKLSLREALPQTARTPPGIPPLNKTSEEAMPQANPPNPRSSQLDMKIILFPGPNSGLGRLSFSQDQLSSIQSACNQHGIRFNVDEKASNKLPFLNKPGMKIDQLFRKVKELFPMATILHILKYQQANGPEFSSTK